MANADHDHNVFVFQGVSFRTASSVRLKVIRARPVYLAIMEPRKEVPVSVSVIKSAPQNTDDTCQTCVPGYYGGACDRKCYKVCTSEYR